MIKEGKMNRVGGAPHIFPTPHQASSSRPAQWVLSPHLVPVPPRAFCDPSHTSELLLNSSTLHLRMHWDGNESLRVGPHSPGAGFLAALGQDRPLKKGIFALSLGGGAGLALARVFTDGGWVRASPGGNGILFGDLRDKQHLLPVGMNAGRIKCCEQRLLLGRGLKVTLYSFSPSPTNKVKHINPV